MVVLEDLHREISITSRKIFHMAECLVTDLTCQSWYSVVLVSSQISFANMDRLFTIVMLLNNVVE